MRGEELSHFDFFFRLCVFVVRGVIFLFEVMQAAYTGITVENCFCRYQLFASVYAEQYFLVYFRPAILGYCLGYSLIHDLSF